MFSALLCVAGGSKTELNKNILAGLCSADRLGWSEVGCGHDSEKGKAGMPVKIV